MERESEIYTHIKKDTENILINAWENSDKIKKSKLHVIARLNQQQANYQSFLIQSVLQLGIVYRKKRDFQQAEILFHYVDTIDRSPDMNENTQNIDAANNLGVCLRKRGLYEDACKIFSPFSEKGNRFACINKMKCELKLKQLHVEDINRLLKKNPYDREVLLIKGAYFKKNKKWNKAMKTYKMAYELAPYIRPGTIGLKAYYNMAVCLLHQHKIYEARKMLEKILEECPDDIPAKIDLGRCLKEIGRYSEALEIYEHMFEAADTNSSININKLPKHSKIKIYNYCGECYLHLKNIYHAKQQFHNVLIADAENTRASYFLAQCAMHEGSRYEANNCRKAAADEYILAMDNYRKASERQPENTQFASAWLINRIELWNKNWWKEAGLTESIERSLKYFSGSYSLNACIALVSYIEHQEQNAEKAAKTKISELYKAFSRIRLDKDEEGYYAFSHFLKNHSFMHLEAETRGKILACLFRIYENTIGIKKLCRYSLEHATNSEIELVHYTKLNVLKKLLEQRQKTPPRMRLWNSVYMNDPYEGETFINLMQCVGNAKCGILESYFPYLKKESQKLTPINSNIYISSLSKQVDNIRMWVQYGDDASGCGIFFEDDFFDIRSNSATATDTSLYTDKDYPLYKVNYIETNTFLKKCEEKEENDYKKIRAHLEKVWTYMDKLEYIIKDKNLEPQDNETATKPTKVSNVIREFVADCLNEIRFLFKDPEYQYEEEVRIVHCSYDAKIDEQTFDIPRLYIEVERDIRMKKVQLGPRITPTDANEIVSWIHATKKVKEIEKSHLNQLPFPPIREW